MTDTNTLLKAKLKELQDKRSAVHEASKPLRDKRDVVLGKIRKLQEEEAAIVAEYKSTEAPLVEIDAEIARVAMALNAKKLSDR